MGAIPTSTARFVEPNEGFPEALERKLTSAGMPVKFRASAWMARRSASTST